MGTRLKFEEARDKVDAVPGFKFMDLDYRNRRSKYWVRFPCGCINRADFNNVVYYGPLGCGTCRFEQGPTFVYLLAHDEYNAFKIGFTAVVHKERTSDRLAYLQRDGWDVIYKVRYETRNEAIAIETTIKNSWKAQGFSPAVGQHQIWYGYTETVSKDLVDVNEIIKLMKEQ